MTPEGGISLVLIAILVWAAYVLSKSTCPVCGEPMAIKWVKKLAEADSTTKLKFCVSGHGLTTSTWISLDREPIAGGG